ncbi:DUF4097 family beta strand repeat-containing protein [uncultured Tyzzerella sp.]|uniref:DUF4097 family beta strand repeat-containing protein n=1 Tax=uncultured Tyzzerella sp. TaxID=2321398 RepID=UPI002943E9AD|nr:DUF4097 family beta strand repeat-containing protein [uncultured Tyzzerella sp.]
MSNERIKILKMLENGEITADEASKLLSAIENSSNTYAHNNNYNDNNNGQSIDFNKIINKITSTTQILAKKTSKIYNDLEKEIKNIFQNANITSKNSICKEFNFTLNNINNTLDLKSLNGEMVLKGYNGNKLTLKAIYIPKDINSTVDFYTTDNQKYIFTFMEDKFEKVSIEILVPKKHFDSILISNINSNFSLDAINFKNVVCDTTNSNGIIENCEGENININNVNGKLIIRNIKANSLKVCNINNYVKLNNIDIKNVSIDVLNGEIDVINDYLNLFDDYNWKIETQNNPINVEINTDNVNYSIDATTSLGRVNILKNNLIYTEKSDYRVVAKTEYVNHLFKNLDLSLTTTNSTIILS